MIWTTPRYLRAALARTLKTSPPTVTAAAARQLTAGCLLALGLVGLPAGAQTAGAATSASSGANAPNTSNYQPQRGQAGKDVIWIATPDAHVDRMLQLAGATTSDTLLDLGSGDGKIVLAAAKMGLRSHGVEYNPDLVTLSQRLAKEAGLETRATFEKADLFDVGLGQASIITMYLLPELNLRLRPKLLELKPGTRIVSHDFRMGKWQPDETSQVGVSKLHLWVVPANAGGMWVAQIASQQGPMELRLKLRQHFQKVEGDALFDGISTTLRDVQLLGTKLQASFTDREGKLRIVTVEVAANSLQGTINDQSFSAQRVGQAPVIEGSGPVPPQDMEYIQ